MNEMTREQAIKRLQEEFNALANERDFDGSDYNADIRQAIEMGIQALRDTEQLAPEDRYLIHNFGMTRRAIARVMWNAMRAVCGEIKQFANALDPDHDTLDDLVDGGLWDDNGDLKWIAYQQEIASSIFMDIISSGTYYGGQTSALEACKMSGINGWNPLRKEK